MVSLKTKAGQLIQRARSIIHNKGMYSHLGEEAIVAKWLALIKPRNRFVVDIAADDGRSMSNTYRLFLEGSPGIAVECNPVQFAKLSELYAKFPGVRLLKAHVYPENVNLFLRACGAPLDFSFLSLDIDSYDYFILAEMLKEYRPALICAEINEIIPPPLKFTVKYDNGFSWGKDHFMGQSISMLHGLARKNKYDLVELHYNNAFLVPHELNGWRALTPEEAYEEGYMAKSDRLKRFPWNADAEAIYGMAPQEQKKILDKMFSGHRGKYLLEL